MSGVKKMAAILAIALSASAASAWTTLPAWSDQDPSFAYTPSPGDWRPLNVYQIMTDRYFDGNQGNNYARGDFDPGYGSRVHGGDFRGIEQKLGYLKELGVKAIWISPVLYNVAEDANGDFPYHGYLPTDFNRIETQFGSLNELRSLVAAAHREGIYVIFDIVVNHMADLISSKNGNNRVFNPAGYWDMWWHRGLTHAAPFDTLGRFHNNGAINNYEDPQQYLRGELTGGLDDVITEDWGVRQDLARIFKALISATDCDGYRIDAVKHVEMDFWPYFLGEIRSHAATLGKTNFLMFGEVFSGSDEVVSPYVGPSKFHSMLNFPLWETMNDVFIYGRTNALLTAAVTRQTAYDPVARGQMVNFLDNHDKPRVLSAGKFNNDWRRSKLALTFLHTAPGIPCIYYGTEQGFNGGSDPFNREDMWDGLFESGPSNGDNFYTQHELFRHVRALNKAREDFPELAVGSFTNLQQSNGMGFYAHARRHGGREAVVALNTHWDPRSGAPSVQGEAGLLYVNLFNPSQVHTVSAARTLPVMLSGYESRILVPAAELPVQWVGDTYHWPTNGALASSNSVWINCESWPRGAGQEAIVVYSTNRVSWSAAPMSLAGEDGNNDWWNANLGRFPAGATVEYAVAVIDARGAYRWDSRGGQNYKAVVKSQPPPQPIHWVGGTYHWPVNGQIDPADNLWINTESWPKGGGVGGMVVYSVNGGAWQAKTLGKAGTTANNDWWNANLGSFPSGATIRYAVMVKDGAGKEIWDNNKGQDYGAVVR